jgi:transcription elongation factor GreA
MLENATVISDKSEDGTVGMNNTVTLYIPEDDETEKYKITTSIRGNSLENKISIESPLGRAILGKKVGDTVTVKVNDDYSYDVVIKDIDESTTDDDDEIKSF